MKLDILFLNYVYELVCILADDFLIVLGRTDFVDNY